MGKKLTAFIIIVLTYTAAYPQTLFQTAAERSDFKSTSDYRDVMDIIGQLKKSSKLVRVENLAVTTEGREVPLLVIGDPLPQSPASLKGDKRIVIYIQANIHAGEVEGKEATLMFARDLLTEKHPALLKDVVLLICPLFNPDGNEKISPTNRTYQNGPANGVGVRYNGQFLDLNRDAMKAESPEVRGVITNVFNRWDPSVFMDCHTTDGSYHVEPVTFTWMVNPNGDNSLISYMRDRMMPEMSKTLLSDYKVENCFYGEFYDMLKPEKGWVLDASEPRYMVNYFGLRNRLGILNENYVYADYKSRVYGCYYLIKSLTGYSALHRDEIKELVHAADLKSEGTGIARADSFAIEYDVRALPEKVPVKTYEAELVSDANGRRNYRKTDRQVTVQVPYFIDYYPVKSVSSSYAYLLQVNDAGVLSLLRLHGIKIEKLTEECRLKVLRFEISDLKGATRLNQGHYTNSVKGSFWEDTMDFKPGTLIIRTTQPLGRLAEYLLEPQSNDGLLTWNFLDKYLVPQWGMGFNPYPVYKLPEKTDLRTVIAD